MEGREKVDIITELVENGVFHLAKTILSHLNGESLYNASQVSRDWRGIIRESRLWNELLERNVASDPVWAHMVKLRGRNDSVDEQLYCKIVADVRNLENRWQTGRCTSSVLWFEGDFKEGEAQCDSRTIVVGSQEAGIKVFDRTGACEKTFTGLGEVSCIQFDERMIICGSMDGRICIWDRNDPDGSPPCNTLPGRPHDGVYDLSFNDKTMICCTHQKPTIIIWDIISPRDVRFRHSFNSSAHRYVNFDARFIVIGSVYFGSEIKVWDAETYDHLKTFNFDKDVRHCQYRDGIVAGATSRVIRIWHVESGACLRSLECLVPIRALRFDSRRIVVATGWSEKMIRVWDLKSFLDKEVPNVDLNCGTVMVSDRFHVDGKMHIDELRLTFWSKASEMVVLDFWGPISDGQEAQNDQVV